MLCDRSSPNCVVVTALLPQHGRGEEQKVLAVVDVWRSLQKAKVRNSQSTTPLNTVCALICEVPVRSQCSELSGLLRDCHLRHSQN